jgi:formylglycine-generating enzyme required for sulfatase activity
MGPTRPSARSPSARSPSVRGPSVVVPPILVAAAVASAIASAQPVDRDAPDTVAVGEFRIDRTEVTVGRFDAFLKATGRVAAAEREGGGAPAAATAAGVNGLHEMAGNLWEWLADARGDDRLTAGGSWWYGAAQTRADGMQWKPARFLAVYVGFRCAYPRAPA